MTPEVRQAMVADSNYFVNMDELMEAGGKRLLELTGAEWGIVTSSATASLIISMTGNKDYYFFL